MEDAATAEISRTQVWHWLKNEVILADGRQLNSDLFTTIFDDEVEKLVTEVGENNMKNIKFELAIELFDELVVSDDFEEFLTLPAYKFI